jgi:hypothetical protein
MDRRMYRRSGENCGPCNRGSAPYRQNTPICGDLVDRYSPEEDCDRVLERDGDFDRFPLGMCYVPWQSFRNLYENEFVALAHGTLFKELDLDFYGRSCK